MQTFSQPFPPLSEQERAQSLADMLARQPQPNSDILWIFAYGSLMWNPDLPFIDHQVAHLTGWRRDYCVWTQLARGTPDNPGLGLGLVAGGSVTGIAFSLDLMEAPKHLPKLWEREMWTDVYQPMWVSIVCEGQQRSAITFVGNPDSPQFAKDLSPDDTVQHIRTAVGKWGSCRDYFDNTNLKLKELGIDDPHLAALSARLHNDA